MNTVPEFIPVGDLEKGFAPDNNSLPPVAELAGTSLTLYFDDSRTIEHNFVDGSRVIWTVTGRKGTGETAEEQYWATCPRPGIYFVDYVIHGERATSVSLVLDLKRSIFTMVTGTMPTSAESEVPFLERIVAGAELTSVKTVIRHGSIDRPLEATTPVHGVTADLIGKRIEYTYSLTEQYEHLYLNPDFYAWHCLQGSEKGLCDVDRCHYYLLDEELYLFVWREKIVPTLGIVLVDLRHLRTCGKIFGYQGYDFGSVTNFPVGARARVLSVLQRDT